MLNTKENTKMLKSKYQLNDFVRFTGLRRNERRFKYQSYQDYWKQQLQATSKIISIFYSVDKERYEYEITYPFQKKFKTFTIRENQLSKRINQHLFKQLEYSPQEYK